MGALTLQLYRRVCIREVGTFILICWRKIRCVGKIIGGGNNKLTMYTQTPKTDIFSCTLTDKRARPNICRPRSFRWHRRIRCLQQKRRCGSTGTTPNCSDHPTRCDGPGWNGTPKPPWQKTTPRGNTEGQPKCLSTSSSTTRCSSPLWTPKLEGLCSLWHSTPIGGNFFKLYHFRGSFSCNFSFSKVSIQKKPIVDCKSTR